MLGSCTRCVRGEGKKSDIRNNFSPVVDLPTEVYVRRTGLAVVTEARIHKPVSSVDLERMLAYPNAELRRNGFSRVRGIRSALIHALATETEDGHAIAVLDRRRLGSIGRRLEQSGRHVVANISVPYIFGTIATDVLAETINEAVAVGVPVVIRHVARNKK